MPELPEVETVRRGLAPLLVGRRVTDGNLSAWTDLYNTLRGTANISEATYQRIQGNNPDGTPNPAYPVLVDVDNLIDYNFVIFYGGNLDAPVSQFINNNAGINNFFAVRNRDPATQDWPAATKAAKAAPSAATVGSMSSKIAIGVLPPSSAVTRANRAAVASAAARPASVPPVRVILAMSG